MICVLIGLVIWTLVGSYTWRALPTHATMKLTDKQTLVYTFLCGPELWARFLWHLWEEYRGAT